MSDKGKKKMEKNNERDNTAHSEDGSVKEAVIPAPEVSPVPGEEPPPEPEREGIISKNGNIDVETFLNIIGNEVDRKILLKLSKVPRYASDLAVDLGISKPGIKKHLDKLERLGLIKKSDPSREGKKQFYCLNPEISLSLHMDLSPNYFNYRVENTSDIFASVFDKLEKEKEEKYPLMVTVYGNKRADRKHKNGSFDPDYLKKLGDITAMNESLKQLGKALRSVDRELKEIEKQRLKYIIEKNRIMASIKEILNVIVKDPLTREIISSFFYRTIDSMEKGISIKKFLEDLYLKFKGVRAGVKLNENSGELPEYVRKQSERIEELEILLFNIIRKFRFITIVRDPETGEERIRFDLD